MISLTLMSPLEAEVEHDIKKFYIRTGPFTFTWECLSPWAKNKWTKKFWAEKGVTPPCGDQ